MDGIHSLIFEIVLSCHKLVRGLYYRDGKNNSVH